MAVLPMKMTLRAGVELTRSQVTHAILECTAIADEGARKRVVAALEMSSHMLDELEHLVNRVESGELVEEDPPAPADTSSND